MQLRQREERGFSSNTPLPVRCPYLCRTFTPPRARPARSAKPEPLLRIAALPHTPRPLLFPVHTNSVHRFSSRDHRRSGQSEQAWYPFQPSARSSSPRTRTPTVPPPPPYPEARPPTMTSKDVNVSLTAAELYAVLDKDGNGVLDKAEFSTFLGTFCTTNATTADTRRVYSVRAPRSASLSLSLSLSHSISRTLSFLVPRSSLLLLYLQHAHAHTGQLTR